MEFMLSTLETVPGFVIKKHFGLVQGSSVKAAHVGKDIMAGLKNMLGGELEDYTKLLEDSRDEAIRRMREEAMAAGANAVLNVRLSTASITAGAAEILVYGTAVLLLRENLA